jgi:hypothetical protein
MVWLRAAAAEKLLLVLTFAGLTAVTLWRCEYPPLADSPEHALTM